MSNYGSVTNVKTETGVTPENLNGIETEAELDDYITSKLEGASDEIDRFCNRTFRLVQNVTETRYGNNTRTIQLRNYPVVTIHSVEEGSTELTEGEDFELKGTRNFEGENDGILKRDRRFWKRRVEYTFEYDWGYPDNEWPKLLDGVAEALVKAGIQTSIQNTTKAEYGGADSISMDGFSLSIEQAVRESEIDEGDLSRLKNLRRPGF